MSDDRHGEGQHKRNDYRQRACCTATINYYTERVWPIEGPTNLRCKCDRVWTYAAGMWVEKRPRCQERDSHGVQCELDAGHEPGKCACPKALARFDRARS